MVPSPENVVNAVYCYKISGYAWDRTRDQTRTSLVVNYYRSADILHLSDKSKK